MLSLKNVNFDYSYQLNNQVSYGLNPSGEFQINNNKVGNKKTIVKHEKEESM